MPKTPGDYYANHSYHMYEGREPLRHMLNQLGFMSLENIDGTTPPQIDRAQMLRDMPSLFVLLKR